MMRKVSVSIVTLVLVACTSLSAHAQGSDQEREACTPDAFRLCTMAMPDEHRVEDCLRRAGSRLSPACYAVFYPPPPATTLAQPRVGAVPQRPLRQQPMQPLQVPDDD